MIPAPDPSATLALAILSVDGAGRVAAGRLLERFSTYEQLASTPREQILSRLPGIPKAARLVEQLLDEEFAGRLDQARTEIERLGARGVAVLTRGSQNWPRGLADLDRADRPVVLHAFGNVAALSSRAVAFLARPPVDGVAFERAQDAVRSVLRAGGTPICGLGHGFDTVICKLAASAGRAAIAIAACGLARVAPAMRPAATGLLRAGGVLVSPFPMDHGPFDHDDVERARLAAAVGVATVFAGSPADSPELRAVGWAIDNRRPVFATTGEVPEGASSLHEQGDIERLTTSLRGDP